MDLHLTLADTPDRSLRHRAEHALREAIRDGRLSPGTRLPSTRALAVQLGVSRGVVVEAYAQLAAEGYLDTRRGGGTRVATLAGGGGQRAASLPPAPHTSARQLPAADPAASAPPASPVAPRYDLRPARPAFAGFPRTAWLAALTHAVRTMPDARLDYPDPSGEPELRATLAAYLGRVRGVRTTAEQVVVTAGLRPGLELLWATLAEAGARCVAHEHPGWPGVPATAASAGLAALALPVDGDGIDVERLPHEGVAAVVVTPAHQYPTGAVLSARRRTALLAWAERSGGLVVEDDYDAEIRYDRQPIGSLQGLAPALVAHGGSVSKTLAPAVRIGWLVLPEELAERVHAYRSQGRSVPSALEQLALAHLIERGDLDRHLRRQRHRYRRQREALLEAVAALLPEVAVEGAAAGLHAVLRLPGDVDERAVVEHAAARGVALQELGDGRTPALVVGYANLAETAAAAAVRELRAAFTTARRGAGAGRARERCPAQPSGGRSGPRGIS